MTNYEVRKTIIDHADSISDNYSLMTLRNSIRDIQEEDMTDTEFQEKCRADIMDMVNGTDDPRQLAEMLDLIK